MRRNHLILLVEDNVDDVELTVLAFQESQVVHKIVVAKDGEEALDYLFATGAHAGRDPSLFPEVVLLDLNLPKVDGLQTLTRMRADPRTQRIPVVVLTSSKWEQDVARSYDLGANSFVQKAVDFTTFLETARALGLYWLGFNQTPPHHERNTLE
ncbi:MAG TPA: response regulator [Vicinamibacterales bacterium]|nr:response regulator [Vicinamibacterales bacterium]